MPLNSTMIAVAVPEISVDFDRDPTLVTQVLVTSYLIAQVVLQSPAGKLGDRVGHARMVVVGQVLVAGGALLGYLAPTLGLLTLSRILMAVGGAALVPSAMALMRHALPQDRRGRAFGAFGSMMALSAALGPVVGGELVGAYGWRSVFAANLPVLAIAAALTVIAGRPAEPPHAASTRFDWIGTVLLASALTAIMLGLRPDGAHVALLVAIGAGLLIPFTLWERRASDPVITFSLFGSVHFTAGATLIALQNLVMYSLIFQIPLVAVALFDIGSRGTGRILLSMMLAMVIISPVAGRLVDHLGPRLVAVAGSIAALVGVAGLAWTDLTRPGQLVLPMVLMGIGLGLSSPSAQSASMSAAPWGLAGSAAGVSSTMRYLGGIVGIAIMSLLLDVHGSRADVIAEHRTIMVVYAGVLVVGLVCAILLPGRTTVEHPAEAEQPIV